MLKRKKNPGSRLGFACSANSAHFHQNWAELAVLFSRQILNGSQDFFFPIYILIHIYFFKYETIETPARAFLTLNILSIGTVYVFQRFILEYEIYYCNCSHTYSKNHQKVKE